MRDPFFMWMREVDRCIGLSSSGLEDSRGGEGCCVVVEDVVAEDVVVVRGMGSRSS